ncbi:MAG: hypothetical protein D6754_16865 [Alphaproteobacteria bacterium]|nr:MAG: hypothetical protein D6754_16865 [Alphaproteobacteria bacterium]
MLDTTTIEPHPSDPSARSVIRVVGNWKVLDHADLAGHVDGRRYALHGARRDARMALIDALCAAGIDPCLAMPPISYRTLSVTREVRGEFVCWFAEVEAEASI